MIIRLIFTIIFFLAASNCAYAEYPDYLRGDTNFILCGGHMGYGEYVDKSSLVVQEYNPPIYRIAVNVLSVPDADRGKTQVKSVKTKYFKYDWDNRRMYTIWPSDNLFHYISPVGSMAETGHFFAGEMAFYIAYHLKFYGGQKWYHTKSGKYLSVNWGDSLYKRVDYSE